MIKVKKDSSDVVSVSLNGYGISLRIGGTGRGEGRLVYLSRSQARQVGHALQLYAERATELQQRAKANASRRT